MNTFSSIPVLSISPAAAAPQAKAAPMTNGTMTPSSTIAAANTPMPHTASSTGLTVLVSMAVRPP